MRLPSVVVVLTIGGALVSATPTAARAAAPNAVSSVQGPQEVQDGALAGAGESYAPSTVGSESVINTDSRRRVQNTAEYPNSAIGQLLFDSPEGEFLCTGFLVDANTVVTSGHCLHPGGATGPGGWYIGHTFTPGRNGMGNRPFGACGATELWTLPGWFYDQRENQDLGIIQLDCDIGDTTGWFGYFSRPGPRALTDLPAHVRGYPGDQPFGTMWTDRKPVRRTRAPMIFYRNDTFGGQSGSPVFQWGSYCAGPCAMAIHGYGPGHGVKPHRSNNHGVRITASLEDLIASVAGQNG